MRSSSVFAAAFVSFALTAFGTASAQVVVSSKIDTEGGVLGNIIKLVLDQDGIATAKSEAKRS